MVVNEQIDALVESARSEVAARGVTRRTLQNILKRLQTLAANRALWTADRYPDPEEGEQQARYLIREDADNGFALYLNVMRPGKRIPPHNHTTWACIAAVEGTENNSVYQRIDGGKEAGPAQLRKIEEIAVEPGRGIALLPDDVHSVEILGTANIRHLHFYGRALETLSERLTFDTAKGVARPMVLAVQTKR